MHLAGVDVIGATAGSLARLVQDREIELWESKRIVAEANKDEVRILNSISPHIPIAHLLAVGQWRAQYCSPLFPNNQYRIKVTSSERLADR